MVEAMLAAAPAAAMGADNTMMLDFANAVEQRAKRQDLRASTRATLLHSAAMLHHALGNYNGAITSAELATDAANPNLGFLGRLALTLAQARFYAGELSAPELVNADREWIVALKSSEVGIAERLDAQLAFVSSLTLAGRAEEAAAVRREVHTTAERELSLDDPLRHRARNAIVLGVDWGLANATPADAEAPEVSEVRELAIETSRLADEHLGRLAPESIQAAQNLLLANRMELAANVDAHQDVLNRLKTVYRPTSPMLLLEQAKHALFLTMASRHEEAEAHAREAADGLAKVVGPDSPHVVAAQSALAGILTTLGKHAEALTVARDIYDRVSKVHPMSSPMRQIFLARLIETAAAAGDTSELHAPAKQLFDRRRKALGDEHLHTRQAAWLLSLVLRGDSDPAAADDLLAQFNITPDGKAKPASPSTTPATQPDVAAI